MFRFILPCLILFLSLGCGGGGDDDSTPARTRQYNLSGVWETLVTSECTSSPLPLRDEVRETLEGTPGGLLIRIEQENNDLFFDRYFVDVDLTEPFDGTLSGNQVHYEYESGVFGVLFAGNPAYVVGDGIVLSDTHVEITEQIEGTLAGVEMTIECVGEIERVGDL